jgi:hypothetical protein
MLLGKFTKEPADRKRYALDYVDWLEQPEVITNVDVVVPQGGTSFFVDSIVTDETQKQVFLYVSGGIDGEIYDVIVTIDTTASQTKQDYIQFDIRASRG